MIRKGLWTVWWLLALPTMVQAQDSSWQAGAFADFGSLQSLDSPSNHLFRTRGTTPRVDELNLNMAGVFLRRPVSEPFRWGIELSAHGGEDSEIFGFSATAPNMKGANWLRRLGPTNLSYLAPVGSGLRLQGGIFSSVVGYDSLYAKDNLSYTRPWSADFTPYLMMGVNVSYPATRNLAITGLLVNGYWHLAHANDVPSFGGQLAYRASDRVLVKQTVLYGPHQPRTSLGYWRILSNTIVERRTDRSIAALDFHVSSERVDGSRNPRAWWIAAQVPARWTLGGPWSVTLRPELAWDSDGRWTTVEQSIRAISSTIEYRASVRHSRAIVRFEHRYDRSTGPGGGFFTDVDPGQVGLTPRQHLLVVGLILVVER